TSDINNYNSYTTCSSSHMQNCPCQANWCSNFNTYFNDAPYNQFPIRTPLELQTLMNSDPLCEGQITGCTDTDSHTTSVATGSLYDLIPCAVTRHAPALELYTYDLLYAYDSNYCNLHGAAQHYCPLSTTYPSHYRTVIQNAVTGD